MPHQQGIKMIAQNRKAFHDYFVEEKYECGVALFGTEVKSIRQGRVNLKESWAQVRKGEVWLSSLICIYLPMNKAIFLTVTRSGLKNCSSIKARSESWTVS